MTHKIVIAALLAIVAFAAIALTWRQTPVPIRNAPATKSTELLIPQQAHVLETHHYRIHYTGTLQQAELIGSVAEKLYTAYTTAFAPHGVTAAGKLTLVLYEDQHHRRRGAATRRHRLARVPDLVAVALPTHR